VCGGKCGETCVRSHVVARGHVCEVTCGHVCGHMCVVTFLCGHICVECFVGLARGGRHKVFNCVFQA
jgi:hypothetical protein